MINSVHTGNFTPFSLWMMNILSVQTFSYRRKRSVSSEHIPHLLQSRLFWTLECKAVTNTQRAVARQEDCTLFRYADVTHCRTGVLFISRCQNIPSVYSILSFFEIGFRWIGALCGSLSCFDVKKKRMRMGRKVEREGKMQKWRALQERKWTRIFIIS